MKKALSIIFLFAIIFSSCEKSTNYSALIEKERRDIRQYIADNGITVIHNFSNGISKDSVCNFVTPPNHYYSLGEDSIYFRINAVGIKTQPVELFSEVSVRYIETTLDGKRSEDYWTTLDLPYPLKVIFGDVPTASSRTNANCAGWQSAIRMMKYSETEAEMIVPSKLGISRNISSVTPCHYRFSFKLVPR